MTVGSGHDSAVRIASCAQAVFVSEELKQVGDK